MDHIVSFGLSTEVESNDSALAEATSLGATARQLDAMGSHCEAERSYHRALELVDDTMPSLILANLWNGLGELCMHMGRLDIAEEWFAKSLDVSVAIQDLGQITTSRDNLAKVRRVRSELLKAKALKLLGAPDHMCCSNYTCVNGLLRSPDLSICGGCKGAFYCSHNCQREDWERHKRHCWQTLRVVSTPFDSPL